MFDDQLRTVFRRVFRRDFDGVAGDISQLSEWDSLSHIKLVMELEREFGFMIRPEEIPGLYRDYGAVTKFVAVKLGGGANHD